jgi:AcrR family transcriptional regulator
MTSPSTRDLLVDSAEQIFARDGFAGASLREIMRSADANPAAVHYHFGGKDGLLEAVLDRVVEPITARRIELLHEPRSTSDLEALTTRDLVEAFLRPDFVDEGSGPAIVFIHAGTWSFVWRDLIKGLSADFRCLTLDHLEIEDAVFVVHDLGGVVGINAAARRSDTVGGIVAINSFA